MSDRAVNLLPPDTRGASKVSADLGAGPEAKGGAGPFVVLGVLAACVAGAAGYVLTENTVKQRTADLAEATAQQQAIARQAKEIKGGFRLAVVGRADPRGNAAANQRLSEKRAAAVTDYLMREAGVRPGSILPQTAIGASHVADDPDQPKTHAEGRRVTITILVSKANTSVAQRVPQ